MRLGSAARTVFPITGTLDPLAGPVLYVVGFLGALVLWGFGLIWLVFALATIFKVNRLRPLTSDHPPYLPFFIRTLAHLQTH